MTIELASQIAARTIVRLSQLALSLVAFGSSVAHAIETVTVIEYYNQALDAYFITARSNEQALLDATAGFSRTGTRFVANAAADASPEQTRICRFYVSGTQPFVSSHFYGVENTDCAMLLASTPPGFHFEGYDFALARPDDRGVCPADSHVPIYRAFRPAGGGKTPNHCYTASLVEYQRMISMGWSGEGVSYCTTAAQYSVAESDRIAAVQRAAMNDPDCTLIAPFYFEIGDRDGARVSGSLGRAYGSATEVPIASASKWIYGAYVTQLRGGILTADDVRFLTFSSGYVTFDSCARNDTVSSCAIAGNNGRYTASADGKFLYAGSHMQTHAARYTTLGNLANAGLADAILAELGMSAYAPNFRYTQPQLAGGIATSANVYAAFLRKMLRQELTAGSQLNAFARCTNPLTCASAIESPFPPNESPNYSIGHWVEDTIVSDGAYSSAGAFGFYPWIDPTKANYGVVARADLSPDGKQAMESVTCGRKLRQAWATGVAP